MGHMSKGLQKGHERQMSRIYEMDQNGEMVQKGQICQICQMAQMGHVA